MLESFRPLPVTQSFLGDLSLQLDPVMHVVQAEFTVEDPQDVGLTMLPFVRLLAQAVLRQRRETQWDHRMLEHAVVETNDAIHRRNEHTTEHAQAGSTVQQRGAMTRRKSLSLAQERRRSSASANAPAHVSEPPADDNNAEAENAALSSLADALMAVHNGLPQSAVADDSCASIESFSDVRNLQYCLASTYVKVMAAKRASAVSRHSLGSATMRCRFDDLRTFVLGILLTHNSGEGDDVGQHAAMRGAVCPLTVTRTRPCKALYHAEHLSSMIMEERDACGRTLSRLLLIGVLKTKSDLGARLRLVDGKTLETVAERTLPVRQGNIVSVVGVTCRQGKGTIRIVFAATADGTLSGFETTSGLQRQKVNTSGRGTPWTIMHELPGLDMVVAGDCLGNMQLWNLKSVAQHTYLPDMCLTRLSLITTVSVPLMHRGAMTAVASNSERRLLFTAGLDCIVVEYCTRSFTRLRKLVGHQQLIRAMAYSFDENVLISAGTEHTVHIWPLEMVDCVPQLATTPVARGVVGIASIADTSMAVSMDPKGTFTVWDLRLSQWVGFIPCEPELSSDDGSTVTWSSFAFDPSTNEYICNANRKLYYLAYSTLTSMLNPLSAHEAGAVARGTAFHSESRTLVSCAGTALQVWDLERARSKHHLPCITKRQIHSMLFMEDEGVLALGHSDGVVGLHLITTFRPLVEFGTSMVEAVVAMEPLSTLGCCFACLSANGQVEVVALDVETNACCGLAIQRGGNRLSLKGLALSTLQGFYLLIGEAANTVTVWGFERSNDHGAFRFLSDGPDAPIAAQDLLGHAVVCSDMYTAASFPSGDDTVSVLGVQPGHVFVSGDSGGRVHVWAFDNLVAWPLAHFPVRKYSALLKSSRVLSLMYCQALGLLYGGDDAGGVSVFDMTRCIPTSTSHDHPTLRKVSKHTNRAPVSGVERGSTAGIDALHPDNAPVPTPLPPSGTPTLSSADVQPIASWDAHPESTVAFLCMVPLPLVLVTVSGDGVVHMWHLGGTPIGCLIAPSALLRVQGTEGLAEQKGIDFSMEPPATLDDAVDDKERGPQGKTAKRKGSGVVPLVSFLTDFAFGEAVEETATNETDHVRTDPPPSTTTTATTTLLHKYNDLPPPYGIAAVAKRKQTRYMLRELMAFDDQKPLDDDVDGGTLLRSLSVVRGADPRNGAAGKQKDHPTLTQSSAEPTLAEKIAAVRRRDLNSRLYDDSSPVKVKQAHDKEGQSLTASHAIQVPPYMAKDKLTKLHDRPLQCRYTPSQDLDEAMYGPATQFHQFCKNALRRAQLVEKQALEHQRRMDATAGGAVQGVGKWHGSLHGGGGGAQRVRQGSEGAEQMDASVVSRHLPASMFPSSLRRSERTSSMREDEGLANVNRRSVRELSEAGSSSHLIAQYPYHNPHPVPTVATGLTLMSPTRLAHAAQQASAFKTMGEETSFRYESELYRPVTLPPLKQAPAAGTSMFAKKVVEPSASTSMEGFPGVVMHVTRGVAAEVVSLPTTSNDSELMPSSRHLAMALKRVMGPDGEGRKRMA